MLEQWIKSLGNNIYLFPVNKISCLLSFIECIVCREGCILWNMYIHNSTSFFCDNPPLILRGILYYGVFPKSVDTIIIYCSNENISLCIKELFYYIVLDLLGNMSILFTESMWLIWYVYLLMRFCQLHVDSKCREDFLLLILSILLFRFSILYTSFLTLIIKYNLNPSPIISHTSIYFGIIVHILKSLRPYLQGFSTTLMHKIYCWLYQMFGIHY